jgi:hypothetical protein
MTAAIVIPDGFAEVAASLAAEREQWYQDLKSLNRRLELPYGDPGRPNGGELDELMRRSAETDDREEAARRRFFPRAHRLSVTTMGALLVSKTGRSLRRVWAPPRRSIWDDDEV